MVSVSDMWDVCLRESSAEMNMRVAILYHSSYCDIDTHFHAFSKPVFFKPIITSAKRKGVLNEFSKET